MDDSPLVLFDGVCPLCNGWARFIVRNDPEGKLRLGSLQWAAEQSHLRQKGLDEHTDSIVLIEAGRAYYASTAVVRMAQHLRFPANLILIFIIVPQPVRDRVYALVARHRYCWFGTREHCPLPEASWKGRLMG